MKIEIIYVCCYKGDAHLAKLLVASIRKWFPLQPISLIKDSFSGEFDTTELESNWNVSVLPTVGRKFRMDFGKLEPLFLPDRKRFLVLDADIVFIGPVLDILESYKEDFIVDTYARPQQTQLEELYFACQSLQELDPEFSIPDEVFNFGQFVGTSGIFEKRDFDNFIEWSNPPSLRHPHIFKLGLQGFMNYWIHTQIRKSIVTCKSVSFMMSPQSTKFMTISPVDIENGSTPSMLMHWCGYHSPRLGGLPNGRILRFYEELYYSNIKFGRTKRIRDKLYVFAAYARRFFLARLLLLSKWITVRRGTNRAIS
jgi:hypothetical protein